MTECNMDLESPRGKLQLWFGPRSNRILQSGNMSSQSPRTPTRDSFGTPPWESGEKEPFECSLGGEYIWGKVVASPESGPWWVKCVKVLVACPNTEGCSRMWTNPLVVGLGCRFKLNNLVSLPSLIPRLLAHPSTSFSAGNRERPSSRNFPQLDIVWPSSGSNKGLRSSSNYIPMSLFPMIPKWESRIAFKGFMVGVKFPIWFSPLTTTKVRCNLLT
jgi:hypothetical protein